MAHECFNSSASDQGNTAKAKSGQWFAIPAEELVAEIVTEIGGTAEMQACFTEAARARLPGVVSIGIGPAKGTDLVIAANSPNTGDGQGIDHIFASLAPLAIGCGYDLGGEE
jgi:hypothetical protein